MCVAGGAPLRPERHAHYQDGWPSPHPPHVIILAVSVRDNEKEGDTGIGIKLKFQI